MTRGSSAFEILDLAMERPSGERDAFVAGAAGDDGAARAEVMSLLAALGSRPDVLEPPPAVGTDAVVAEPLTGLTFGAYEVGERIGEGGMGVVYAARDTRLERMVAVKALPPALARDVHRRARLEQEARLLAALNHPNIAAIHGVEETPRGPVLVLEFVPGRTLAQELAERRLSIEEAVGIAIQIARGLESAHAAGIVHRDLKPANIKITPQGGAKILDLGVAKAASDRWTRASLATDPGVIVGSAAYMSPEQARGRPVDRRTDLWALGCVLYEMLADRRAFEGATASDTLAAVLTGQPDLSRLPAATPSGVRRLLMRCIEKDPERRLRDAGDAVLELEGIGDEPMGPSRRAGAARWIIGAAALVGLIALAVARPWEARPAPDSPARVVLSVEAPGPLRTDVVGGCLAISPDGRSLIFAARTEDGVSRLYLRRLDSFEAIAMASTDDGAAPFFSPDGRWVAFYQGRPGESGSLMRVPLDGGPAQRIATLDCHSACWADDGTVLVAVGNGMLRRMPVTGGPLQSILPDPDVQSELHSQPDVLPGSRWVLFTCWRKDGTRWRSRVEAADLATGRRHVLMEDARTPRFVRETGMLVYLAGGAIMAAPLDVQEATIKGDPRHIVGSLGGEPSGYLRCAVSARGTVAYIPGDAPADITDLAWFNSDGTNQTVFKGDLRLWTLRLSPDASRVAYTTNQEPEIGLWVMDMARGNATKFFTPGRPVFPTWTPDGARIAFQNTEPDGAINIAWTPADTSGRPEVIYSHPGGTCLPTDFSSDGRLMLIMAGPGPDEPTDIFVFNLDDRTAKRLLSTPADRTAARFSPDMRLVAYASTETGRSEVYVHPYPALDTKVPVSVEGGERPTWSADGKRLFWRFNNTIYCADVANDGALGVGLPRVVLRGLPGLRYDTAPDGQRFIMGRPRGSWGPQTKINVVVNALTEERAVVTK